MRPLSIEEISNPLARPEQLLKDHHSNMLNQLPNIWKKTRPQFHFLFDDECTHEEIDQIVRLIMITSILAHDFGKLAPAFQIKIKGVTLPRKDRKLSFHNETSAVFARELFINIMQKTQTNLSNEKTDFLATIVYYLVVMHHQKVLQNLPDKGFSTDEITRVSLQFKQIFTTYTLEGILKIYQQLLEQVVFPITDYLTINDIQEALTTIEQNISNKIFFEDIIDDVSDTYHLMGIENSNYEITTEIFFLIEFSYSILCDLDEWDAKFHLANEENVEIAFDENRNEYPGEIIEFFRKRKETEWQKTIKLMSDVRNITFDVTNNINFDDLIGEIRTLTAPTGSAKTLSLLNLGFKIREILKKKMNINTKIIYCLPFITITEQVAQVIKDVMGLTNTKTQSEELTVHHHLAPIYWNKLENPDEIQRIKKSERDLFFTKLWRSDVIITTFVRFWESVLSCKKSEVLRFHRMANSIIIFDEMQAIPTQYWDVIYQALKNLSSNYNCTIINATATQPLIIPPEKKKDLIDTNPKAIEIFAKLNRYDLIYHQNWIDIDEFITTIIANNLLKQPAKDVMIVLNTKRVATYLCEILFSLVTEKELPYKVYFLSRNVLSNDRKDTLEILQKHLQDKESKKKCLLICTQLIEAGVDISFEEVYRDIAPLSSIIQVAGRCNRGMELEEKGIIHIFNLMETKNTKIYEYSQIYDCIELRKTRELLAKEEKMEKDNLFLWDEVQLRELGKQYYLDIARAKDTSKCMKHLKGLQYFSFNEDFKLIKHIPEETLFIIRNDEANRILQKIKVQQKKKKRVKHIPRKFYEFIINVSKRDLMRIRDIIEPYPDAEEPVFWILRDDGVYNPKWGLRI